MRDSLARIVNKFNRLEKRPLDFGTGEFLHPSEIHTMDAVGRGTADTVTALAELFGITKGAVSQIVNKLHERGYVTKERNKDYSKEINLSLTEKGLTGFRNHAALHRKMEESLGERLAFTTVEEMTLFGKMITILDEHLDEWIKKQDEMKND